MPIQALVFDAYGTLLDVESIAPQSGGLSQLWRRKQLEYTWLSALMDRYEDFQQITAKALRTAARQLLMEMTEDQIHGLLDAYLRVPAFDDARTALQSLTGLPLAILSNGTLQMVEAALRYNGLNAYFNQIISVDEVRSYKPSPRVYALGPEKLKIPAAEILFVSSNWWDAAGAKAFGYQVCWCNRSGAPFDAFGTAPDFTVPRLDRVADIISGRVL